MQQEQRYEEDDDLMLEQPQERYEHYRFTVDKGQTMMRIDKYLVNCMGNVSRNRIQEAADADRILVNDKPVKSNYKVKPNDVISIVLDYPRSTVTIEPQDIPIEVVYEDDDIILVNKQPNLVVHPGFGNFDGTLLNAVAWHMRHDPKFDANNPHIGLVHRIDKDTSGLLVVAKNDKAHASLAAQIAEHSCYRHYLALLEGNLKNDSGTVETYISRNPNDRKMMAVTETGKLAITHYKVLERLSYVSLIECNLETGRTHQIRVHMKHIGHILFNDDVYGGDEILKGTQFNKYSQFVRNCFKICPRQALHAKTLGFVHPTTGEMMNFDSQLPDDFQALLAAWRNYSSSSAAYSG